MDAIIADKIKAALDAYKAEMAQPKVAPALAAPVIKPMKTLQ